MTKTNLARRSLGRLPLAILFFLSLAPFSHAQAASIAIDTLAVSSVALTVVVTGDGTYSFSEPVTPPVTVSMGTYQDPIVGGTGWKIYSTNLFGEPAPTGSVDGALGSISVDFSSLRGQITTIQFGVLDFALWPLTNPPSGGSYNSTTGVYVLNWTEAFSTTQVGYPYTIDGTATVALSGTVTLVPVPAALWLLGSGLIGLAGVVRRRHKG